VRPGWSRAAIRIEDTLLFTWLVVAQPIFFRSSHGTAAHSLQTGQQRGRKRGAQPLTSGLSRTRDGTPDRNRTHIIYTDPRWFAPEELILKAS
jgi:hypothetical protein